MKKSQIILLLILHSIVSPLLAQTNTNTVKSTSQEQTVYFTATGVKYHKSTCRFLAKSKTATTLPKAKKGNYTACKVCKPGGSVTTTKTVKKSSSDERCSGSTQKGTRCKRSASPGSNTCWQH
jgi:hypothetical protein